MDEEKIKMFRNRLAKVYKHKSKLAKRSGVTCYRIYDHDLPEFPLCIELYEDQLYVAEYKRRHGLSDEAHDSWLQETLDVASELLQVPHANISLKLRQRKEGRLGQYQKLDAVQEEFVVMENGLQFIINLKDYLDTGLFLDHRNTRQLVREMSAGKKVLNLFCYTGSFSVYAAAGNAAEVVSVDLSNTYIKWAERNMQLNGFTDTHRYTFVPADVLSYLKKLPPDYFDIIIMDPPTFSNSKKMDDFLDIQRDHVALINDCTRIMKPGGTLFFSTNFRRFVLDQEHIKATMIKDITKLTTPFDFEGKLFRYCYRIDK